MVRVCESNIILPGVQPSLVRQSVRYAIFFHFFLNHWVEFNQTCYITFPHWGARATLFFLYVCPGVRRPFICPSCYLLLNYRADLNQTCYMTSPHCNGVREQNCFIVRLAVDVHPFVRHSYLVSNHWAEFNQTYYRTSFRGKVVRERVRLSARLYSHPSVRQSVMLLATKATSVRICNGWPSTVLYFNMFRIFNGFTVTEWTIIFKAA